MNSTPKITVLMPVYNVADYVREAIYSILNQTFTDFELLIINDGSTDKTRDEVLKIADQRIRFVENERNIGLANTLNKGIELSRGEYIARMDGDDISLPERLAKQADVLDNNPEIDVCGAGYRFFGARNYDVIYPKYHHEIKVGLMFGCCMIIPLFRRQSILNAGLSYNQNYFPAEDYRFWTECVTKLKMHNIQEKLFLYRMHPSQVSETMTNQPAMAEQVKADYIQSLFPEISKNDISQFIHMFSTKIVEQDKELEALNAWVKRISTEENTLQTFEFTHLKFHLNSAIQSKLMNYVSESLFIGRYSLSGYLKFIRSGFYFKLPLAFRIKVLIKAFLHKKLTN